MAARSTDPVAETDLHALRSGAIAVTPLHLDMTHDATLADGARGVLGLIPGRGDVA